MSWLAGTRLVAGREIAERLQSRVMRVMTVITTLLVVAGIVIPAVVRGSSERTRIGLVGSQTQPLGPALLDTAKAFKLKVTVLDVADAADARSRLDAGTLAVALSVGPGATRAVVEQKLSPAIAALLQQTLNETHVRATLARAGVSATTVRAVLAGAPLRAVALHPPPSDQSARQIAALAAGLLMYLTLSLYGAAVATGVAQEKTSRTAEVLLAAVRPSQLLAGKVSGIGLTGLTQLAIAAAGDLVANAAVHSTTIPSSIWILLPVFLVYFLLGFTLYAFAFAFAAAGALVARQEEVQFVTMPFGILLVVGYLLVYVAIASPNATWLRVISFLPPLTASLMPARIALGHIGAWEPALQALLMGLSIFAVAQVTAHVYAHGLIQGGAKVSWRAALRPDRARPTEPRFSEPQPRSRA